MQPQSYGIIREFNTKNFRIRVEAEEDYDVDLSFDEDGSVRKDLEAGKLISFSAKVTVAYHGWILSTEYLGGCIYKSISEFNDILEVGKQNRQWQAEGATSRCGSYMRDMIHTAIDEARAVVRKYQTIKVRKPS